MAQSDLRIADFNEVQVSFAGVPIDGWSDGDVLTLTREADVFGSVVGVGGSVARYKTNDNRATITISLLSTSPVNAALSAIFTADLYAPGGAGIGAFTIIDLNGTSLYTAGNCWISRPPDPSWSNEPRERVWTFQCATIRDFSGGNL
jgi:hypothetical protein